MSQEKMNLLHETIMHSFVVPYWNGIITDVELIEGVRKASQIIDETNLTGLIDQNTGLRY